MADNTLNNFFAKHFRTYAIAFVYVFIIVIFMFTAPRS